MRERATVREDRGESLGEKERVRSHGEKKNIMMFGVRPTVLST